MIPASSWAETTGSYVNAKGMRQLTEKGLEPLGSSLPAWMQIAALARTMGLEPTWTKLKDLRGRLMAAGNPSLLDSHEVASPATTQPAE